jgi:hypothetical protein
MPSVITYERSFICTNLAELYGSGRYPARTLNSALDYDVTGVLIEGALKGSLMEIFRTSRYRKFQSSLDDRSAQVFPYNIFTYCSICRVDCKFARNKKNSSRLGGSTCFNMPNLCTLPPEVICVFHMVLTISSDCFA